MSDQILKIILENSFTIHQLRYRLRVLKAYLSKKLFSSQNEELDLDIRNELNWINQLGEGFFNQITASNFSQLFHELELRVEHLSPLVIYFAYDVNQSELDQVGAWLRRNYGPEFVFESKLDPTLIAGCAFVWKGVYRDFSLKGKIEANSQAILEIVRNSLQHTK